MFIASTSNKKKMRYCINGVHHNLKRFVTSCRLWPPSASSPTGEFWLGLRKIHSLVTQGNSVLHIQLEDWKQGRRSTEYRFYLNGPERNYTIQLTHLSGDLPDPMSNHTGLMFSTKDRDNRDSSCAHSYSGSSRSTCGAHVYSLNQGCDKSNSTIWHNLHTCNLHHFFRWLVV